MQKLLFALASALFIFTTSCDQAGSRRDLENGTIQGELYTNEEIGWSMTVPDDWDIISKDVLEEKTERGNDIVAESMDMEIDYGGLRHLINFQHDESNLFQSNIEPFVVEYEGEWSENNKLIYGLLYDTFTYQGLGVDTVTYAAKVDGLSFEVLHITLYSEDGEVALNEVVYSKLINGYSFTALIIYTNEEDEETLMEIWNSSEFTIRD